MNKINPIQYNPKEAALKNSPEQQIIRAARNVEYDRKYRTSAEDKLNQEDPTPSGVFKSQSQGVAREIVSYASDLVDDKKKGNISNAKFAARMAQVEIMVGNLGKFTSTVEANLAAYNDALKNGTLSYGMDQHDEAVLQAIDKGEVTLALDKEGRVKMEGKGKHPFKGNFDVNIYDFVNIPTPVRKIKPINTLVDPIVKTLGLDENGVPNVKVDKNGKAVYDTGDYGEHRREILEFSQEALKGAGPEGIRSYLGDHLNMPSDQIKALAENLNYTDEEGTEWENQAVAEAYKHLNGYMKGKYQRKIKPHPNTLALEASNTASDIASEKGIDLASPDAIQQAQQTEVVETPQGEVAETATEEILPPSIFSNKEEIVEDDQAEVIEKSPLTMKNNSAKDLIKKYS